MSVLSKLLGTFQPTFQIGKGGPKIKNNAGVVETVDAGGTTLVRLKSAVPTGSGDTDAVVTVGYFNANPPTSAQVLRVASIKTGSYATTYQTTVTVPNAAIVSRAVLRVVTGLDAGITVKMGTDEGAGAQAARFQDTGDNDPQTPGIYDVSPFLTVKTTGGVGADQDLLITLSSLPTVGEAYVFIEYVVPSAIS